MNLRALSLLSAGLLQKKNFILHGMKYQVVVAAPSCAATMSFNRGVALARVCLT